MTELPRDDRLIPMPVLSPRPGRAQHLDAVTGDSTRSAKIETGVKVVLVTATTDAFIRLGDGAVTASAADDYISAGIPLYLALGIHTHLAVISETTAGKLHVSEMV